MRRQALLRIVVLGVALLPEQIESLRSANYFQNTLKASIESVVEESRARILSEDEYHERLQNRGLHPAHAEKLFNAKLLRAISLAQERARSQPSQNRSFANRSGNEPPTLEQDEEWEFWAGQSEDLHFAEQMTTSDFQKEQFRRLMAGVLPTIQMYFCIQINIDLSLIPPYIPLLRMNLGFMGGIYVDTRTGCWGGTLEASIGLDWGFKVLGYTVGIGVSVTGSVDFSEVPPSRAIADPESEERDPRIYAPEGADLSRCYSKSPWPVLQTFWEAQIKSAFSSDATKKKAKSEIAIHEEMVKEFKRTYGGMLDGPFQVVRRSHPLIAEMDPHTRNTLHDRVEAPRLIGPAIAMSYAVRNFAGLVPSYASQVVVRLCDNSDFLIGADNEREASRWLLYGLYKYQSYEKARLMNSDGRFLARWPSSDALHALEEKAGDGAHFADDVVGVTRKNAESDMRVVNFAKVMRLSKHRSEPIFWKELAMSTSNLMMRTIGDVNALSATFLAADPHWDGSCEALPISFDSAGVDTETLRRMKTYPWASRSTRPNGRVAFVHNRQDDQDRFPVDHWDSGNLDTKRRLFPHLWCGLAAEPAEGARDVWVEKALDGGDNYEVSVSQACETVVTEFRDLEPGDIITWDDKDEIYTVRHSNQVTGFLQGEGETWFGAVPEEELEAAVRMAEELQMETSQETLTYQSQAKMTVRHSDVRLEAMRKGYKVASKVIESRPECERAQIPAPFARLFPRFVKRAAKVAARLEFILLDINSCVGEVLNRMQIVEVIEKVLGQQKDVGTCANSNRTEALAYVRQRAKDAVRLVRRFLLEMGAQDPRKSAQYRHGEVPVDHEEISLIKELGEGVVSAPAANELVADFASALGLAEGGVRGESSTFAVGDRVRLAAEDKTEGTIEALGSKETGRGLDVILDGMTEPIRMGSMNLKPSLSAWTIAGSPVLSGRLWQYAQDLSQRLQNSSDPLARMKKEPPRLRPPVEFTNAVSVTFQLSQNGFCNPSTGLLMASYISSTSWQTWSKKVSEESCWIGRVRPGNFFIQIMRCQGNLGGQDGDFSDYVDWRVRYQGVLLKGDLLSGDGASGIISNLVNQPMETALVEGGTILGGLAAGALSEKLFPKVRDSNLLTGILMAGTASAPLMGVVGGAAVQAGKSGFLAICKHFLQNLADAGIITEPDAAPDMGWSVNVQLVMWGSIVHRAKAVHLTAGPQGLVLNEDGTPKTYYKYHRFVAVHVENFNRIQAPTISFGPGGGGVELYGKLELDWDLTPWVERKMNAQLFLENQERIKVCAACLRSRMAFCDWRVPLETLWTREYDVCVEDTPQEQELCARKTGVVDDIGNPVTATYYSIQDKDGLASCQGIPFPMANREFRRNDMLRRYFRRH